MLDKFFDWLLTLLYGPVRGPVPQVEHERRLYAYARSTEINLRLARQINARAAELERENETLSDWDEDWDKWED